MEYEWEQNDIVYRTFQKKTGSTIETIVIPGNPPGNVLCSYKTRGISL